MIFKSFNVIIYIIPSFVFLYSQYLIYCLTNPVDCISCGGGWLLWSNWNQRHVDETLKLVVDLVQTTCTLAVEYMET